MMVTAPEGAIFTNAGATNVGGGPSGGPWASSSSASKCSANTAPPPATAVARRKVRRVTDGFNMAPPLLGSGPGRLRRPGARDFHRAVHRLLDAQVGAAAAYVAGHRGVDLRVARPGISGQQRRRRHDLAGLAIAALRHVDFLPRP